MDEETSENVKAVFDNDMLRELILDFAIHPTNDTISRKTLCSIRHVQKCWKLSISDFMRKNKEPLYKVVLDGSNSIDGTAYVQQRGKILEEFMNFFANRTETFCLSIKPEFFRLENYKSFLAVLQQANTKLVELDMLVPINGGSLPCMFPNVYLPNLQTLSIELQRQNLDNLESDSAAFQNSVNIILLIQSLLNRNESLKILKIQHRQYSLPGFQYISLPTTITKLTLVCLLSDQEMEILVQTKLPNLQSLIFLVPNRALPDGLISGILNNFQTSLTFLHLKHCALGPFIRNPINFPVMKKLKSLRMSSLHIELESRLADKLNKCFPQLNSLDCCFQTEEVFRCWIATSNRLESVTSLTLVMVIIREAQVDYVHVVPSVDVMQGVRLSMPNLCNLTILLQAKDSLKLQALFSEMVHLKYLKVCLLNTTFVTKPDLWDSLLTGIPVEIVAGLRAHPNYWENFQVKQDDKPSFRMLKNLSELYLNDSIPTNDHISESLISSFSFKFALNQMTNLKLLKVKGRFKVSDDIVREWENQKRKIDHVKD